MVMNATVELTRREAEIAELIAWGGCKKEVASHCHIAVRTVENHVRNIYEKIGVTKVNELSAWWFCTRYSIPFSLSPLARKVVACFLLFIFSASIHCEMDNLYLRLRRAEERCENVRRVDDEPLYI
jgi:DNA-binding CsgD family transcriptional regulator